MARDTRATRNKLLAAALNEFVEKGFSGARVDSVAREAKVNKRMIYHYFGSKKGIWDAIFGEDYWNSLSAEQKTKMQLWKMLASDQMPSNQQDDLIARSLEIADMQAEGLLRNDVDPVCVAAIERLVQQASGFWVTNVDSLSDPVEQLTELLTRLLRPRIRVKPRVVSV